MSQEVQECPTHGPRDCRFRMRVFGVLGILAGMGLLGLGVIAMLAMLPGLSSAMPPGSPAMPSFPMLFGVMAAIMGVVTMIACSLVQLGYLIYVRRFFVAKELAPPEEAH